MEDVDGRCATGFGPKQRQERQENIWTRNNHRNRIQGIHHLIEDNKGQESDPIFRKSACMEMAMMSK